MTIKHSGAPRSAWLATALTIGGLAFASSAGAVNVTLSGFAFEPARKVRFELDGVGKTVNAGEFVGVKSGVKAFFWCTEPFDPIPFNKQKSFVRQNDAWTPGQAEDLGRLVTWIRTVGVADAVASAVFQSAIWEIDAEASGDYDFSSGPFTVTSNDAAVQAALDAFDWSLLDTYESARVINLFSDKVQDLLDFPVEEPGTLALLGLGLLGFGLARRRRA